MRLTNVEQPKTIQAKIGRTDWPVEAIPGLKMLPKSDSIRKWMRKQSVCEQSITSIVKLFLCVEEEC